MSPAKGPAGASSLLYFLAALLVLLLAISFLAEFTISSDKARRVLTEQIEIFTQRDVIIDGDVEITVSLTPRLVVERIHVKNTEGFGGGDLFTVSKVHVRVALLPLLTGKLRLEEFHAAKANISMIHTTDGRHNWSFDHLFVQPVTKDGTPDRVPGRTGRVRGLAISEVNLADINIRYKHEEHNRSIEKHLSSLLVDFEDDDRVISKISGTLQGYPYSLSLESDPVYTLFDGSLWQITGRGNIAESDTKINAGLQLSKGVLNGSAAIDVRDVNVGVLLEQLGIIAGERIESEKLSVSAAIQGRDLSDVLKESELDLVLGKGNWTGKSLVNDENRTLVFTRAGLMVSWKKPVKMRLDGILEGEPLSISLKTNRLKEFFDDADKLAVDLSARFAGGEAKLDGVLDLPLKTKRFHLDLAMEGKDLERLNRLFSTEFPPFNNYRITGKISSNAKGYVIRADDAAIGDTHFKAAIVIDTSSKKPYWSLNLESRQLQIRDFEVLDSRLPELNTETVKSKFERSSIDYAMETGQRLKQIVDDPAMHLDLNVTVEKIIAGDAELGSSSFKLKLRDDTLILQDTVINVPDGKIQSAASFAVENGSVTGSLKLDIEKFDYGVVVRYLMPGSTQGGIISTRIDLELEGSDFGRLLDQANGTLDVAVWPVDTQTRVFDIWATNLFLLILPEIRKDESRVNCMVALMDIEDGIMNEDFFGIDTTKVWMYGNITVNFPEEHVTLSLYPNSKTARLFAVQAPIRAQGRFDNLKLNTNPVDLTVAYLSFVTSPLHVPARRLFADKVPEDASEACERFFSRDYVNKLKEKIDAEIQKDVDEWLDSD